ncbi:hypothetical protein [Micromonospora purpureochromogenes]|uniref:Uncharacterized protein n=1 Tax=Micromonospora purpureochromogenes TaxID=47872 RepID=A0ABX2RLN7_9ACTN|nr:hypothetical protein [Micromonospora purpureochromogenes]NYF56219.1 hypothetical protein [Micromonospora purpureochromogenes]
MVDSQHTPARVRPAVVTISSYLLILFALIQVINLIIALTTIGTIREVMDEAYRGTSANGVQGVADFAIAFSVGGAIVGLLLAIVLAVLGLFNNRGVNGTRITTWVLGGLMFCCCGLGTASNAAGGLTAGSGAPTDGDVPSAEEVQRRLQEALPSWYGPVTTLLAVIALLALLTALILLALPKANEFFRKPQQVWEPPVPGATYPGQPSYPAAPGYPASPGYPQAGYPPAQPGQPSSPGQPGYPPAPGYPAAPDQPPAASPWQPPSAPSSAPPSAPSSGAPGAPWAGQPEQGGPAQGQDRPGGDVPPSDPTRPTGS